MDLLQQRRIRPPEDLPGAYVINTAATMPGKPPLDNLYRSIQVNKVRSRYIVCRILIAAEELAAAAGPATSPEDDAGRLLLQASLLLRRTPPNCTSGLQTQRSSRPSWRTSVSTLTSTAIHRPTRTWLITSALIAVSSTATWC